MSKYAEKRAGEEADEHVRTLAHRKSPISAVKYDYCPDEAHARDCRSAGCRVPSAALKDITRHSALGTLVGAIVVLISRLATIPKTFWEGDELLFAAAIQKFDPWSSRPHPPGYPLYVGLGKFFALFTGDPFLALVALSVIASVIGFIALSIAFRHILEDADLAVCGALFFYFSASML